jgi:hypothetical protein
MKNVSSKSLFAHRATAIFVMPQLDFDKYGEVGKDVVHGKSNTLRPKPKAVRIILIIYTLLVLLVIVLKVIIALVQHGQSMVKTAHLYRLINAVKPKRSMGLKALF